MALTYPLALDVFGDRLRPLQATFDLVQPVQINGSADGTIYTAANGSAMWEGAMVTAITRDAAGQRLRALFDVLRGPDRTFLIRDRVARGPQRDPGGAVLANRNLALAAVETSRIKIGPAAGASAAEGFPPELQLLPGDMIGWQYGVNPVRYALHRVSPAQAAYGHDAAGVSEWIDVLPNVRGAPQVGDPVQLVSPVCKAVAVPGSIDGGARRSGGGLWEPISFRWRQTLR